MKTLREYLSNANHYLYPDKRPGGSERQRKQFLTYCQNYGLEKVFLQLVEKDAEWRNLAESKPVYFFEDAIKPRLGVEISPSISLIAVEGGKTPVIKLIVENKEEYRVTN